MSTNQEKLFGRLLLKNDILQLIKSTDKISVSKIFSNFLLETTVKSILGMTLISSNKIKCNRCGTVHIKNSVKLPNKVSGIFCEKRLIFFENSSNTSPNLSVSIK